MVITLIGYRGSGKSTVAGPLAARLGWRAVDADEEIERRAGKSIRRIFAEEGEPEFRARERDVMAELLASENLVIAAGGGAVLEERTRRAMREAGPVVWLHAPVEVLRSRMADDETTADRRPELTAEGRAAEIETLLARREPLYRRCATVSVETAGRSVEEVVEAVLSEITPHRDEEA